MKKRILMLLTMVAVMVVMLAMSVAPAFAKNVYVCTFQSGTFGGFTPKQAHSFEKAGTATCHKGPKVQR
jgi:hypothetical protein